MLLLDGSRQRLRAALDHARLGNIKEAHLIVEATTCMSSTLLCAEQRHLLVSWVNHVLTSACAAADGCE